MWGCMVCTSTMSDCEGICLPDHEYDEFMEQLAGVSAGRYVEGRFAGDTRKSRVWMDASGALWCRTPQMPGKTLRCVSMSQAASDPDVSLPVGEWPSQALYRRLVEGGVAEEHASTVVAKLYKNKDCRTVIVDAVVERIIAQNRK
jgi:hypothetical protein